MRTTECKWSRGSLDGAVPPYLKSSRGPPNKLNQRARQYCRRSAFRKVTNAHVSIEGIGKQTKDVYQERHSLFHLSRTFSVRAKGGMRTADTTPYIPHRVSSNVSYQATALQRATTRCTAAGHAPIIACGHPAAHLRLEVSPDARVTRELATWSAFSTGEDGNLVVFSITLVMAAVVLGHSRALLPGGLLSSRWVPIGCWLEWVDDQRIEACVNGAYTLD